MAVRPRPLGGVREVRRRDTNPQPQLEVRPMETCGAVGAQPVDPALGEDRILPMTCAPSARDRDEHSGRMRRRHHYTCDLKTAVGRRLGPRSKDVRRYPMMRTYACLMLQRPGKGWSFSLSGLERDNALGSALAPDSIEHRGFQDGRGIVAMGVAYTSPQPFRGDSRPSGNERS